MSQLFSAWKSPDSDQMARAQLEQNYDLPYFTSADVAFPGQPNSDLRVGEFFNLPRLYGNNISYTTENQCLKNSQIALPRGLRVSDKPIDASCAPQEKKFLIFDRSGNHTRLFFSPSFSPQNQVIASKTSAEKVTSRLDERFLLKPVVEEKWNENRLNDGEGEMLEDTEEIDALLYSDSDDDEYDEDNDEVTSTRHVPFRIEEGYDKGKLSDEEVASCDGLPKRQRLLDGGYKRSSLVSFERPLNRASSCNDEDDYESSYVGARNFYDGIDASKRDKKVKIRETLKILESIIPGLKNKDPVSIIEKAIVYLESMKIEAEALGLTDPESKSATYP